MVRSAVFTAVFFLLAPGTMAGPVPWLITGWDLPDQGAGPAALAGVLLSFVKGYEEPRLTEQFGESYERYRRAVPGWWPRRTPYRG